MNALLPPPADTSTVKLRVLSLGAGVQSTALALMAAHGEIDPVECAIFADVGWEPSAVMDHLAWLMSPNVLPFPVHIVSAGNIRQNLLDAAAGKRWASIPAFTRSESGEIGMIRRQCTKELKIVPIRRKVRKLAGIFGTRSPKFPIVEQLLGISRDEIIRMKPSREAWQVNRFPLVEMGMTRRDCLTWLERHGYPTPPKSACIGCPFHSDGYWRRMRDGDPDAWADAVEIDRTIRAGLRGIRGEVYLHRSAVPLDEADLSTSADHGQLDLWPNECEGMCGL